MTTARPATFSDSHVGEVFDGRYAIERLIGRGGMGLVYLARDKTEQREVVLKLLAPHWAGDPSASARFEREGQRLAQLSHPNIVKLLGLGRSEDRSYIVMEYVDGEPLQRYLSRHRRLNLRTFAPIAAQISSAVGYVHDKSIMLRDIKPPNVMLCEHEGPEGRVANFVKLLDFGLAKMVEGDDVDVTRAHVVGTAGYLAPEQIKGEDCDVRVDVYSLGILFFTMLTGKSPIPGDNDAAVLYHHVHGEPVRLETVLPAGHQVPPALIELVHRCLAKSPDDRPANGHAVTELLFEALPHSLFELPLATDASRTAMRSFRPEAYAVEDDATRRWSRPLLPISGVHQPEANSRGGAQRVVIDEGRSASASQSSGARRLPPPPSAALHRSGQSSSGLRMPSASQSSGARRLPAPPIRSTSSGVHPRPSSSHTSSSPLQSQSGLGPISFDPLASNEDLPGAASAPGGFGRPSLARQPSDEMVMPSPRLLGLSVLEQEGLGRRRGTLMASVGVVAALMLGGGYLAFGGHGSVPDVEDMRTNGTNVADGAPSVVEASVQKPEEEEKAARALPVQIIVPSGAALTIDGEPHGKGDYRGALTPGRHDIELEYTSGQRHQESIEVRKGGELIFEVGPVQPTTVRLQSRGSRSSPPPERPTDRPAKSNPKPAAAAPEQDTAEKGDAEPPPTSTASPELLGGEGEKQTERDNPIFLAPANSGGDKGIFLPVGK